jgi:hypothetical protein
MLLLGASISTLRGDKFFRSTVVLSFERSILLPGNQFLSSPRFSSRRRLRCLPLSRHQEDLCAAVNGGCLRHLPLPFSCTMCCSSRCRIFCVTCSINRATSFLFPFWRQHCFRFRVALSVLWFFFPGNCTAWETTGAAAVVLFRFVSTAHALQF